MSNGDGQANLVTTGSGAKVLLTTSTGVGTPTGRIGISAPFLSATATGGGVYLNAVADLETTVLSAVQGSVDVLAAGALTLDSVVAGTANTAAGAFAANAVGAVVIGTATSTGTQMVHSGQSVTFTTLTATGITGDVGDIGVTADAGLIQGTTVGAHGSASLVAATTNKGASVTGSTGSVTLTAGGLVDWTALNAGTTMGVRSTGAGVILGAATSGGTQTIRGAQDVNFATLTTNGITGDVGDIGVTSDNGLIQGVTVDAHGSASLTAATTNKGTALTARTGSATLLAGGLIDWPTLNAGTQINVRSTGAAVNLGAATSGGTQTIRGAQDVNFATLTTNGITGDVGDIGVTSNNGLIQGVTVDAHGSASLTAATINKGTALTARTGSATLLAGGLIDWPTLNAGTQINVRSTGAAVNLGTATSGGSQTIRGAQDVDFHDPDHERYCR